MKKVKVCITELQERLELPVQIGISIQQVAQQARSENGQKVFEIFWQEEEELCIAGWARCTVLKSFLVASASCHFALPHFIRPILRVLKFVPKLIL